MTCVHHLRFTTDPLELVAEFDELRAMAPGSGALVSFTGLVRDFDDQVSIRGLEIEHYAEMAEAELQRALALTEERWSLAAVRLVHRVGRLSIFDPIVFVGIAAAHRAPAFAACEFLTDLLKTEIALWKKELRADGDRWLEPKVTDRRRWARWGWSTAVASRENIPGDPAASKPD